MNKIYMQLLKEINEAYPDAMIEAYFDLDKGMERRKPINGAGDTLALFIGRESYDIYETLHEARETVICRTETAIHELQGVITHLAQKNLETELRGK